MALEVVNIISSVSDSSFLLPGALALYGVLSSTNSGRVERAGYDLRDLRATSSLTNSEPITVTNHYLSLEFDSNIRSHEETADETRFWLDTLEVNQWWNSAFDQFDQACSLPDGWDGEGSRSADPQVKADAAHLLRELASAVQGDAVPLVGLDVDGIVVLTWDSPSVSGSLSVNGDGTFSYFIESAGLTVKHGSALVESPLPLEFISALTT